MGDLFSEPAVVGIFEENRAIGMKFHVVQLGATEKESSWEVLAEWSILPEEDRKGSTEIVWWTSYIIVSRAGVLGDKSTGVYPWWEEFCDLPSSSIIMRPKESGFIYHVSRGVGDKEMAIVDTFRPAEEIPVGSDVYACLVVSSNGYYEVHGQGRRMVGRRVE